MIKNCIFFNCFWIDLIHMEWTDPIIIIIILNIIIKKLLSALRFSFSHFSFRSRCQKKLFHFLLILSAIKKTIISLNIQFCWSLQVNTQQFTKFLSNECQPLLKMRSFQKGKEDKILTKKKKMLAIFGSRFKMNIEHTHTNTHILLWRKKVSKHQLSHLELKWITFVALSSLQKK